MTHFHSYTQPYHKIDFYDLRVQLKQINQYLGYPPVSPDLFIPRPYHSVDGTPIPILDFISTHFHSPVHDPGPVRADAVPSNPGPSSSTPGPSPYDSSCHNVPDTSAIPLDDSQDPWPHSLLRGPWSYSPYLRRPSGDLSNMNMDSDYA